MYKVELSRSAIIKVCGQAEIEDYARLNMLMQKWNHIADAIGCAVVMSDESQQVFQEMEEVLRTQKDRNQRAKMQRLAKEKKNPKSIAESMGIRQDAKLLEYLREFIEVFCSDLFTITIVDSKKADPIVYRGILNPDWLRTKPTALRMLYGGTVMGGWDWTMVGQVVCLPQEEGSELSPLDNLTGYLK